MNKFLRGIAPGSLEACNGSSSFLQSGFWGNFKAQFGWEVFPFRVQWEAAEGSGNAASSLLVMRRRLVPGLSFAYVPWGPELPDGFPPNDGERTEALFELAKTLRPFLPGNTAFIRFDPPWHSTGKDILPPAIGKPFVHSSADVQAPDTVVIDLAQSEEDILASMKKQWLYNRRMALKRGLVISRPDEGGLNAFYSLLQTTAERTGIAIHDIRYYKTLFALCKERQGEGKRLEARLYLAEHEGEALAAMIILFWGEEATYLYAASSDNKRNLMPSFALKIQAILDARSAGIKKYDLFGIPPNEDPSHPMAGLYRFKTGFGGNMIHRPGSWDYFYRPLAAKFFRTAESLRKKVRDRKKTKSSK